MSGTGTTFNLFSKGYYSPQVMDEVSNPHNMGHMADADFAGTYTGPCKDMMAIYIKVDGEYITKAGFFTDGCESTTSCGSILSRMVEGLTRAEAGEITDTQMIGKLGGLPKAKEHCASLTWTALRMALTKWDEESGISKP